MAFKNFVAGAVVGLLSCSGAMMGTAAQAQIAITGGTINITSATGIYELPTLVIETLSPNVTGTLQTQQQGSFQAPQGTLVINKTSIPVLLDPTTNGQLVTLNMLATGVGYTPNGPVLFANIPTTVTFQATYTLSNLGAVEIVPGVYETKYIINQPVVGGQFGADPTIATNQGVVSLAVGSFSFNPFPPPVTLGQQLAEIPPPPPPTNERVFLLEEGINYFDGLGNSQRRPPDDRIYSRIFPTSELSQ